VQYKSDVLKNDIYMSIKSTLQTLSLTAYDLHFYNRQKEHFYWKPVKRLYS